MVLHFVGTRCVGSCDSVATLNGGGGAWEGGGRRKMVPQFSPPPPPPPPPPPLSYPLTAFWQISLLFTGHFVFSAKRVLSSFSFSYSSFSSSSLFPFPPFPCKFPCRRREEELNRIHHLLTSFFCSDYLTVCSCTYFWYKE